MHSLWLLVLATVVGELCVTIKIITIYDHNLFIMLLSSICYYPRQKNKSVEGWEIDPRGAPFIKNICHVHVSSSILYLYIWFLGGPKIRICVQSYSYQIEKNIYIYIPQKVK